MLYWPGLFCLFIFLLFTRWAKKISLLSTWFILQNVSDLPNKNSL
jgi:hypothetical protein